MTYELTKAIMITFLLFSAVAIYQDNSKNSWIYEQDQPKSN